ncbi:hypothetical protein AWH62_04130 [Maricaulis sp. W15]|nr:hypothetical protein AWH62_04130 [Maricaulis sp. W15]
MIVLTADHHAAPAHSAHVHGVGHLTIAIDADGVLLAELQTPGDNLFGFEGAPRTAAEQRIADLARSQLADGNHVVRFNNEAECVFEDGSMDDDEYPDDDAHSNVRIVYQFTCAEPDRLTRMETDLFEAFERFEEIETVFLSPRGQEGFALTAAAPRHRLAR